MGADDIVVVFAYARAGLGHLRVTDALYSGLPPEVEPILLGSHDEAIEIIHRITSANPIIRGIYQWMQNGPLSDVFSNYYKKFLKRRTSVLYDQLSTILEQRVELPKKVLMVATHFGLAHQLVAVKERLEKEKAVKIYLVVQVTDDTFHPMWYVEGAEVIFVPSQRSKLRFMEWAKEKGLGRARIEVVPYPVSQKLSVFLTTDESKDKLDQLMGVKKIKVLLPLSGAAVLTDYYYRIIKDLVISGKFEFHIVSRASKYAGDFLGKLVKENLAKVYSHTDYREVVDLYDELLGREVLAMEITKPSEQAFKAILGAKTRGGAILLFAESFGQQEVDNLDFLARHNLLPSDDESARLIELAKTNGKMSDMEAQMGKCSAWRGIKLPKSPDLAVKLIVWCVENGILAKMFECDGRPKPSDPNPFELRSDGVKLFWAQVAKFMDGK